MAVDMFIKIEGIDGESLDKEHKGEIDVVSWSWGMSQSGSFHMGGGGGSGKVNIQDLSITKYVDSSTPNLMAHCSTGKHIPEVLLTIRKAGGDAPLEYYKLGLKKVLVSSLSTGGSGGEDRLTENATFNFAEVEVLYQPQSATGEKEGGEIRYGFNVEENVAT